MTVDSRQFKGKKVLILTAESEWESSMMNNVFGSKTQGDGGFISMVAGSVQLSDGYAEHYISLEKGMKISPSDVLLMKPVTQNETLEQR